MADETVLEPVTPDEAAVAAAAAQADAAKAEAAAQEGAEAAAAEEGTEEAKEETTEEGAGEEAEAKEGEEGEEASEETKEEPAAELDASVWGSTGNETGDAVLKVLQDAGAEPAAAKALLYDAVQSGDVTKIDEAALTDLIGAAQAKIVLMGAKNFINETNEANAKIVATVHQTAGGEENWAKVSAWAEKGIPEGDLNEYRELINAGGAKARFATQEMLAAYNGDASNTSITAPRVEAAANTPTPPVKGITAVAYVEALEKAYRAGNKPEVIAKIKAQRAAGRKQGI